MLNSHYKEKEFKYYISYFENILPYELLLTIKVLYNIYILNALFVCGKVFNASINIFMMSNCFLNTDFKQNLYITNAPTPSMYVGGFGNDSTYNKCILMMSNCFLCSLCADNNLRVSHPCNHDVCLQQSPRRY